MTETKRFSAKNMALIGMMTAIICICGPLSVPIGPIPVSLTPLAIFLTVCIIGKNKGTFATILYLLIGLVGLPVFSGFTGGPGKLLGPTGGYLVSFFLMAYIAGIFIEKFDNVPLQMLGCLLGLTVSYTIGTIWLSFQASMSIKEALAVAVLPFVIFDLIKIVIAVLLGKAVRSRI
ncbi:MAG: biotin transporter BioY [Lachnospiraceae bacterium]|nr:biotin transporter BioY [Lachnospiraceae bacterium]